MRRNRKKHGRRLLANVEQVALLLRERKRTAPAGINYKLVFKLELNPKGSLTDDQIRQLGLNLLARDGKRAIVVFPNEETLATLRDHIRQYAKIIQGSGYGFLSGIDAVAELGPEDRRGFRLGQHPLRDGEVASLDIELWHPDSSPECSIKLDEIARFLEARGLRLTDRWIGNHICLARAKLDEAALEELLKVDYVKEIERRPSPSYEMTRVAQLRLQDIDIDGSLPGDLVGILVIDSGITAMHPLLQPVVGDAQVFPDALKQRVKGGAEDGDERWGGHGTAVAGIAAYYDLGPGLESRRFQASARIFSARVTDDQADYDDEELLENQLEKAVKYFLEHYPSVRVINISLGNASNYYRDNEYQFRLAAAIDELAYRLRERNILFVICSGNYYPSHLTAEEIRNQYPRYLLECVDARILDPGTAALALTVGGLSYGEGRDFHDYQDRDIDQPVARERGFPSPFTRAGWGVDGAIKPDFVDYAGNYHFTHTGISEPNHAGIPTTNKHFASDGRLFRTVVGTSFSAPRVANVAARLFREFPNASSNLIRALLANSAIVPASRPEILQDKQDWDDDILRIYGNGQPDFERARWSASNDVLLIADRSIRVDEFLLYTIPPLPEEFFSPTGNRFISATLAFDPPTRHTRADSYLGITMEFAMYRNVSAEELAAALEVWDRDKHEDLEDQELPSLTRLREKEGSSIRLEMMPRVSRRKKGTLQHGTLKITRATWKYNREALTLVVVCQRKWAPPEITDQNFAVVVSLSHQDETVDLYSRIRQQAQVYQRIRARV